MKDCTTFANADTILFELIVWFLLGFLGGRVHVIDGSTCSVVAWKGFGGGGRVVMLSEYTLKQNKKKYY